MSLDFSPADVNLDTADPTQIICYVSAGKYEYNGRLGACISALFVILIVSSAAKSTTASKRILTICSNRQSDRYKKLAE
jgi:hypothetical protein